MKISIHLAILTFICLVSCQENSSSIETTAPEKLGFTRISPTESGVKFTNKVKEDLSLNFLSYPYIYNGAGVATGDINNDGLIDIYFVANQGPNKLFLNKGEFEFEDITFTSKTTDSDGFSTGVTMLDVNNDGWLDLYACKAAALQDGNKRKNKLYINNQDNTFTESAEKWGIADPGFSTQAYPIDYDKDGDLDLYILNYRADFKNNTKISGGIQKNIVPEFSDQLYRNDGNSFQNVTTESGLSNKSWGLGVSVGDFNTDGLPDLYVSNDYLEPDNMYINQGDGTFKDEILERINHISFNSMGSDYADINNDGLADLYTVDMLADDHERGKENMASMSTRNFETMVRVGYHHQYMSNMLHLKTPNGVFNEVAQLSGIAKTDWSWAPLIADLDNDGLKDFYITNGIYKDITNQDFRREAKKLSEDGVSLTLDQVYQIIPSDKLTNYAYKNHGNLHFEKVNSDWGLDESANSNGASYADLDNDGDLDLVVNNFDEQSHIYRNDNQGGYLDFEFKGVPSNTFGIGTTVTLSNKNNTQHSTLQLTRGFESSVAPRMHFGVGDSNLIEHIEIQWPDGSITQMNDVAVNQLLQLNYSEVSKEKTAFAKAYKNTASSTWEYVNPTSLNVDYQQKENEFNDYSLQLLLPHKKSTIGSAIAVADINGDGLEDFFVGNAKDAAAELYIQQVNGTFDKTADGLWKREASFEDTGALFFDADGDGDKDLYVVSGGYERAPSSVYLQDRLYINNGKGNFSKSKALPTMLTAGKNVTAGDYDGDGDTDLFVGGYVVPGRYPEAPRSYLLENINGIFEDVTASKAADAAQAAMVSESIFSDYDSDGDLDLITVGEWSAIQVYKNENGKFSNITPKGLEDSRGWWQSITSVDMDGDGDEDYILGNIGGNNKFHPTQEKPLHMYAKDFDDNGSFDVAMSKINKGKLVPVRGKECSSEQNPFLLDKIGTYKEFASNDMAGIYGEQELENALHLTTQMMESVYVENLGNGVFKIVKLPTNAQVGPTMSALVVDLDNNGQLDIVGSGAIYDAEVETIRYDGNFGYAITHTKDGWKTMPVNEQPWLKGDIKDSQWIEIGGEKHLIATANKAPLVLLKLKG